MPPLLPASQQALMKALAKDASYRRTLCNKLNNVAQHCLGDKVWIAWKKELNLLSHSIYFYCTTLQGSQTLGEEYAGMIQVDSSEKNIPSKYQHVLLVVLQYIVPYFVEKAAQRIETNLEKENDKDSEFLLAIFKLFKLSLPVLKHLHLLIFYMQGRYLTLPKRLVQIRHVSVRGYADDEINPSTFRWLTALGLVQTCGMLAQIYKQVAAESNRETESVAVYASPSNETTNDMCFPSNEKTNGTCVLCVDTLLSASVTTCGHVFCWRCILQSTSVKPECPVCRAVCYPSRVVRLHHYDCD